MVTRFIDSEDMENLMACERECNKINDPDFQIELMNSWSLSYADVMSLIRQTRDKENNIYDTRTVVLEMKIQCDSQESQTKKEKWLCGGFIYEIQPDRYEIVWMSLHPEAPLGTAVKAISAHMKKKCASSKTRHEAVVTVRDFDDPKGDFSQSHLRISKIIEPFKKNGFDNVTLHDSYFGRTDAWQLKYVFDPDD